jgi:hypothetical protein
MYFISCSILANPIILKNSFFDENRKSGIQKLTTFTYMRKNILSIIAIICISLSAQAQTLRMDQVPKVVSQAFHAKYATAIQESWEQAGKDIYQVGYFYNKKRQTARFDATGKWLETETEINFNQVPRAVSNAVSKQFNGYDIQIVSLIDSPSGEQMYEIVLFRGKENYDVTFSAKGEVLKKEAGAAE